MLARAAFRAASRAVGGDKPRLIIRRSGRGAMTRTDTRGGPILDGVETAVAAARVAASSATRSAFHRGLAQTPPPPPGLFLASPAPHPISPPCPGCQAGVRGFFMFRRDPNPHGFTPSGTTCRDPGRRMCAPAAGYPGGVRVCRISQNHNSLWSTSKPRWNGVEHDDYPG